MTGSSTDPHASAARPPSVDDVAALRSHPRFPAAFEAALNHSVAIYRANRIISRVLNDRGRVAFGLLVLYLHFAPGSGGLTVGGMKALCRETGLCSPGRATAMLSLMRFAGYVEPAQHPLDRRVRLLVPTARLIDDQSRRMRGQLAALAQLAPEGTLGLAHLDDLSFVGEMAVCFGEAFRAGYRLLGTTPELVALADRNAGIIILMSLMLARAADDTMPPRRPVVISISALSKRCGVSRPHILKLLRDAATSGFIAIDPTEPQRITVLAPLAEALQNFMASVLAFLAYDVRVALARLEAGRNDGRGGGC